MSILPRHTVEKEVGVSTLAAVGLALPGLVRPVGIIHRRGKPLTPTVTRFVDLLREAGNERAGAAARA